MISFVEITREIVRTIDQLPVEERREPKAKLKEIVRLLRDFEEDLEDRLETFRE